MVRKKSSGSLVDIVVPDDAETFFLPLQQPAMFRGLRLELFSCEFHPRFLRINGKDCNWPWVQLTDEAQRKLERVPDETTSEVYYTILGFGQFRLTRRKGGMHVAIVWIAKSPVQKMAPQDPEMVREGAAIGVA